MSKLLTTREVADMLGVGISSVKDRVRERTLPHVRVGRCLRFRRESILAWIDAQERESVTPPRVVPMERRIRG